MATFPFPMPSGWFGLCYAHELAPGELKKVRLAGSDLVVFRTESGETAALDNYCPHLGAPLHQGCVSTGLYVTGGVRRRTHLGRKGLLAKSRPV